MANYRCPYCQKTIRHKPEMAGDVVACSSCGGEYYEPTDPLPGMRPEKVPPPLPSSPVAPRQNQPPATSAPTPPANSPHASSANSPPAPPSSPAAASGPPALPSGQGTGPLSDKDFDSMIQALSAEAVMPDGNPQAQPPPGATDQTGQQPPASSPATPPIGLEPAEIVAALESRGLHSILVSWPPAKPYAANMAFSAGLAREGANDMLLKIAFQIIKQRWPELGSMLTDYENQVH